MEKATISNEQFETLNNRLVDISNHLTAKEQSPDQFVDNDDFIKLMKISKRTAQNWRDEGKIAFSQIGGKIYYRFGDIDTLLKQHYNRAFSPDFKSKSGK